MKTKISNLLALLTLVVAAILIENAFLQSMTINNRAYDLIAKTAVNEISPQNLNLMKAVDKVALAETMIPLFPGAQRLTFGDANSVRYRIDASAGKVANFYNQIMSLAGWSRVKNSGQKLVAKENLDRVIIALAENPITKKTEAIFYNKPVGANEIFSAQIVLADDAVINSAPQEPIQPVQPLPPADNQTSPNTLPSVNDNNQPQLLQPPMQPDGQQPNNTNNNFQPQPNGMQFVRPQGGDNNNGQQGPSYNNNGGGNNGQSGPSEEDIKKMDERRFNDMKRGLNQFTRSIKMMKKSVAKTKAAMSKCGVSIPEELSNALNSSDSMVEKINNAKTADELDEVVGDIEDIGSVMQDWGPRMGDLNRLCQMMKQADRDLKQLGRSLARYQAKNSAKMDISEILAGYKTNIDAMRQVLAQAKELAKTDADEALTKLEDDFYGNMDNVRNSEQAINMVINIGQGIRQAALDIKKIDSNIKILKKKKLDTTEIEVQAADFKQQIAEIKTIIKGKFDVDELISKVETAFDIRQQIYDAMQEYGIGMMMPQIKENKSMNVQVNLPDAFKKQGGNEDENAGQGDENNNNSESKNIMPKF